MVANLFRQKLLNCIAFHFLATCAPQTKISRWVVCFIASTLVMLLQQTSCEQVNVVFINHTINYRDRCHQRRPRKRTRDHKHILSTTTHHVYVHALALKYVNTTSCKCNNLPT